jgi:hypothetical protein
MAIYGTTFVVNWLIFSHFGMLFQEKSGNPDGIGLFSPIG